METTTVHPTCRSCLGTESIVSDRCIDADSPDHQLHIDRITFCFPDLSIDRSSDYCLCEECSKLLQAAYRLKRQTCKAEVAFREYIEQTKHFPDVQTDNERPRITIKLEVVDDDDPTDEAQPRTDAAPNRNVCSYCRKTFRNASGLAVHERIHTGDEPYACRFCPRSFIDSGHLKRHERIHTGDKPYKCQRCDRSFGDLNRWRRHEAYHARGDPSPPLDKVHRCAYCGKEFNHASHLTEHRRTHTGEKPFECKQCAKRFCHSSSLMVHQRTHTGEKPYSCMSCAKTFNQMAHLRTHERSHTGERPFSCRLCDKTFVTSSILLRHMKVHTNRTRIDTLPDSDAAADRCGAVHDVASTTV